MDLGADEVITTILVSTLHCGSCITAIQGALATLNPPPSFVDVSLASQSITVQHRILSAIDIAARIEKAGYDPLSTQTGEGPQSPWSSSRTEWTNARFSDQHLENCDTCRANRNTQLCAPDRVTYRPTLSIGAVGVASAGILAARVHTGAPAVSANIPDEDAARIGGTDMPEIRPATADSKQTQKATGTQLFQDPATHMDSSNGDSLQGVPTRVELSVGGMTCASCVNTLTGILSDIPGTSEVYVNLIGKSATAVVQRQDMAAQLAEAIEDAGFEAEIMGLQAVDNEGPKPRQDLGPRTVSLCVSGMNGARCPEKVMGALKALEPGVIVTKPLTSFTNPIFTVEYTPSPPDFTVRNIISAIAGAGEPSTPFTATIHHPPTVEDRSRALHRREQRDLLTRLLFSVVFAIPTFILGVVYASLVPSSNATRKWLEEPLWTGNVSRIQWALFFLATPVMFYSAGAFHQRSLKEIYALWRKGSRTPVWRRFVRFGSMNLLVSTGVAVAYFASIALLALAAAQEPSPDGKADTTTYFDSVVLLTMFLLAGRSLESYSKGRTADALTALGKLRPSSALLVVSKSGSSTTSPSASLPSLRLDNDPEKGDPDSEKDNLTSKQGTQVERINAEFLEVGDIIRVPQGATPPADGTVVSEEDGSFDESSLTGESRPVRKQAGDKVFLGTINKAGPVDVRVDEIGGQTMLDHIVKVVREGQSRRAPIERAVVFITSYFVPVVTLLALTTWVLWLALGLSGALPPDYLDIEVGGWPVWSLEFAIAVFVVACPCGISLAAPTALLVGSGLAARFGILARGGGEAFQEAAQLDVVVFDKTGTLTQGSAPTVTDAEVPVVPEGYSRAEVLGLAMELEGASSHPLAIAVVAYCKTQEAVSLTAVGVEETPGRGLKASFPSLNATAVIGNEAWMAAHGAHINGRVSGLLDKWKSEGKSVVLLAVSTGDAENSSTSTVVAAFAIADPVRPEAKEVIERLQVQGLATWMISGDNAVTAKAVARSVGIPETNVIAEVLPHQKAEHIQHLQRTGPKRPTRSLSRLLARRRLNAARCVVAMVGDGINDAPALAAADVGVAIGSGSDVALASAAFVLVSANLRTLLTLTDLARTVFRRIKFNFFWASVYNLVMIPVAAGAIYPAGHTRLSPVWASLAMALSSLSVVCSSLLLRLYREPVLSSVPQNG